MVVTLGGIKTECAPLHEFQSTDELGSVVHLSTDITLN